MRKKKQQRNQYYWQNIKKEKLKIKDKILVKQNELKLALDKTSVELVYDK